MDRAVVRGVREDDQDVYRDDDQRPPRVILIVSGILSGCRVSSHWGDPTRTTRLRGRRELVAVLVGAGRLTTWDTVGRAPE